MMVDVGPGCSGAEPRLSPPSMKAQNSGREWTCRGGCGGLWVLHPGSLGRGGPGRRVGKILVLDPGGGGGGGDGGRGHPSL